MSVRILAPDAEPPSGAIFVDARRRSSYERGHIPGAIHLAWEDWCEPAPPEAGAILAQPGYWGVLRDDAPIVCAERLAEAGVCSDRPLVVYSAGRRSRGREGRIAWMLLYLGASDVCLLDGGLHAWQEQHGAEQATRSPEGGYFDISPRPERRTTLTELSAAHAESRLPRLVDTRSQREFDGEIDEWLPRRGHIPSATLFPFTDLFDESDRYVGRDDHLERLPDALRGAGDTVAYCEVGVRASLFAMIHEAHTGQVIPVFDGSLMQWSLDPV
ncbi:MAG TPA: rhodanese-like domain-containing protein, partial [Chloroflexota bacterium]